MKIKLKRMSIGLYYLLTLLYLEYIFRIFVFDDVFRLTNINMIIYILVVVSILNFITKIGNKKSNVILFYLFITLLCLWFAAQYVVKNLFGFYISFSILQIAGQIGNGFIGSALIIILKRIIPILIFFIPLIISIIFRKRINLDKRSVRLNSINILYALIFYFLFLISLFINKDNYYSAYNLYNNINDPAINIERLGVINTFNVDLKRKIFGFEEKIHDINDFNNNDYDLTIYEYNNLDIDFDGLINSTTDEAVKNISTYFKNKTGTLKNEYTGFFENKNIIFIMAESFNEIAVRKDTTPTLYKLVNSGFVFNNFYTQTIGSTLGGEFQLITGLYANSSSLPILKKGTNLFPMGLANAFEEKGYNTYAFHNHYYTFQDRNVYLKSMGFDNFKGCYNGLEKKINCNLWPESDVELIDATYLDYIDSDKPFLAFYSSVSGHGDYSWYGNMMSYKNKEEIEKLNLPYSDREKAYLAAQMELDKALEKLLFYLESNDKLDDTVIVLAADHYPYMLSLQEINNLATYEKDEVIEINHSNLIIYNSNMENVEVTKVVGQMDIIPTIYNLFNIPYDSRLFIGTDALSNSESVAIFVDRSWISDYGSYYSENEKFIPSNNKVNDDYKDKMISLVNNKVNISKYIMEKDYYRLIWPYVNKQ